MTIVERALPQFETKDSGKRDTYASGMNREPDTGRPRFDLLVPENVPFDQQLLTRCAALMERGALKYAERNWERADSSEELERMKASAFRHFMQWVAGETDEDHAAAVLFNILATETTAYKIKRGRADGD
ncbi:dATP/dGTP diphosphohydrolase domain-containing protein [Arthrobacter bambusae]|uniref:tRNA A37 N6-isopentenylltransferase MiaA n=1 Tax=Arthrobacter bambusae TaxID=1338426 RepID=A0AAW8DH70_9MICC|nr:dATP/dGTP diphosphohydrolase domain-containing protein [Arthrobacter bambusae]MDP9904735.1 tRNA A37 N6-isopentenylltransferase MiaA [Arthrobacter bambusae]MDQ0129551.1 tRNA A37 N6-isopentenylltransferase MiaA [Arthrobacter bambusae]MDQ0180836.1 tRNA A37 N6-isopentenylltransferase MiaA [Arthrobacter bambusae]